LCGSKHVGTKKTEAVVQKIAYAFLWRGIEPHVATLSLASKKLAESPESA